MTEHLKQLVSSAGNELVKWNVVREYTQARILQSLQESGAFRNWVFLGGTALRFVYNVPRFSEDLDFSLDKPGGEDRFEDHVARILRSFDAEGYRVSSSASKEKTVRSAFIRFEGLLWELGLGQRDQKFSVKIEIDTNPPAGGATDTTVIRRHVLLNLLHFDMPTMLSGKIHAVMQRKYFKGRDLYDLVWYLSAPVPPEPNMAFLNNAMRQTGWDGPAWTAKNWRGLVLKRIRNADLKKARDDVEPFLERREEIEFLTLENLGRLLWSTDSHIT